MNTENRRKVVLVGPVLPFRGGIAQHTTMLKRALANTCDTLMLSFSRQYPAWLFPGKSDRDPTYGEYQESNTEYLIDSLNPLSWKKTVTKIIEFNPQIIVIPWWTVFWVPCFGYISWALKKRGFYTVFFCHNVVEHEAAAWKTVLTKWVLQNTQHFIVHTKVDKSNLQRLMPEAEITVFPHPIYDHFPAPTFELKRRRSLELLFYGFVRPYKGLTDLIHAMGMLKGQDIQLTIAGEFWKGEKSTQQLVHDLGLDDQIEIRPHYHSDKDTAELFARADVVVLPYRNATGSGVVPIAYHYDKPVVVTCVGGLPDVVNHNRTGFIVPTNDVAALANQLKIINADLCHAMKPAISEMKKQLSWERLASVLIHDHAQS